MVRIPWWAVLASDVFEVCHWDVSFVVLLILTLCGPSAIVLTSKLSTPVVVGCFGRLDRCATLAYEL